MLKVALTHDVDRIKKTYQYFTKVIKYITRLDIKKISNQIHSFFKSQPYWNFDKIIEIESKYNVKSTFFFLNESIKFELLNIKNWQLSLGRYDIESEKIKHIIQYLDQNGWEIGLHGSYNSFKSYELLSKGKKMVEKIVGHEIIGIRQHYLNLDKNTWRIQKEVGFKYDSSFGYTNQIGFKENKNLPFHPFNDNFVVFPLIIMDYCFMNEINRWNKFKDIVDKIDYYNGVLVINWHQRNFNEKEYPGYKNFYEDIIIELKNRNAIFKTLSEFYTDNV